jgi:hypothetical protein
MTAAAGDRAAALLRDAWQAMTERAAPLSPGEPADVPAQPAEGTPESQDADGGGDYARQLRAARQRLSELFSATTERAS